jgi:hypothetical protein
MEELGIVVYGPSTGRYSQGTPLDSSISEDIKVLINSVNQFQAITKAQYLELGNRHSSDKCVLSVLNMSVMRV